jgi:hypothetical protein
MCGLGKRPKTRAPKPVEVKNAPTSPQAQFTPARSGALRRRNKGNKFGYGFGGSNPSPLKQLLGE